jgi:tetratricopeptide (TPR) repeat protein
MRHRLASLAAVLVLPLASLFLSACNGPRVIHEEPILITGDRVASVDSAIDAARAREVAAGNAARRTQDSVNGAAASACAPEICAAIGRGEVVLGMTEAQLFAATRSAPSAWTMSPRGNTLYMAPASSDASPRDAQGSLMSVQFTGGRLSGLSRLTRAGLQYVMTPSDTSAGSRTRALADALVREGDDYVAAGDRERALERYDRALVLRSDDALLNYKVATLLDQQLRPVEALMRYQRFLLQMELQRIDAQGTRNAKLAEAIALAQQRVVILDRRPR